MSRYFVTDPPVAVYEFDSGEIISDTPPNIIYIKPKMDMATDSKVKSELLTLGADNKTMEARLGANSMALLIHNIVKWEGPDLGAVPCTPDNIRRLDPTEPHIARVLEEIAVRNKRPVSPNPKPNGASTSASAGAHASNGQEIATQTNGESLSLQLATGISRSNLQSAINGRLSKSSD